MLAFPRVEVLWMDACMASGAWACAREIKKTTATILTRGFLLGEDEDYYTVAQSVGLDHDVANPPSLSDDSGETFGGVIKIPRSWTTYIEREVLPSEREAAPRKPPAVGKSRPKRKPRPPKSKIGFAALEAERTKAKESECDTKAEKENSLSTS